MPTHAQDDETRTWFKATSQSLCGVLLLATLIRGGVLLATHGNLQRDPDGYRRLADNLSTTGVYGWRTIAAQDQVARDRAGHPDISVRPTAFRPPLYPWLLVAIGGHSATWPIGLLHFVLGAGTCGLVYCLGRQEGCRRQAIVATLLVACDPILVQQSTLVMTETLATFLAALTMVCVAKMARQAPPLRQWDVARIAVTGGVLGLCILCRPTFLPWLPLIILAEFVVWRGAAFPAAGPRGPSNPDPRAMSLAARIAPISILAGATLLVVAPWAIRNQMVFGQLKLTTTHGGYTVLLGNNPLFYDHLRSDAVGTWDGESLSRAWSGRSLTSGDADPQWADLPGLARRAQREPSRDSSEFEDDRLAYRLAWRYMCEQPGMCVYASALRVTRLWRCLPHRLGESESRRRTFLRYLVAGWYLAVYTLAVVGLMALGRNLLSPAWLPGLQLCLIFTAVHTLYWSDMRMRAPLAPFVCLAAARGLTALGDRWVGRKLL